MRRDADSAILLRAQEDVTLLQLSIYATKADGDRGVLEPEPPGLELDACRARQRSDDAAPHSELPSYIGEKKRRELANRKDVSVFVHGRGAVSVAVNKNAEVSSRGNYRLLAGVRPGVLWVGMNAVKVLELLGVYLYDLMAKRADEVRKTPVADPYMGSTTTLSGLIAGSPTNSASA